MFSSWHFISILILKFYRLFQDTARQAVSSFCKPLVPLLFTPWLWSSYWKFLMWNPVPLVRFLASEEFKTPVMCYSLNFCKAPLFLWKYKFYFLTLSSSWPHTLTHALLVCKAFSHYSQGRHFLVLQTCSRPRAHCWGCKDDEVHLQRAHSLAGKWLNTDITNIQLMLWKNGSDLSL